MENYVIRIEYKSKVWKIFVKAESLADAYLVADQIVDYTCGLINTLPEVFHKAALIGVCEYKES